MTAAYLNVDGHTVLSAVVRIPRQGAWWVDAVMDKARGITGPVTFRMGPVDMVGTVDERNSGTFATQERVRIVGGGGGWGTHVEPRHYHNDAGVSVRTICEDAARNAGEQIGTVLVSRESLGADYVRESGSAARVIEDVIGDSHWYVGFDGKTNVGRDTLPAISPSKYTVLEYDPAQGVATIAARDISAIQVGAKISEGLDEEREIREIEVRISPEEERVRVWVGESLSPYGRLRGLVERVIKRSSDGKLFGKYKYRVVSMDGDRVKLQSVSTADGLPDLIPVAMRAGASGVHSSLSPGGEVLVEFIAGNRTEPIITAFATKGASGHAAQETVWSVAVTLKLGSDSASEGATLGTSHKSWADGHTHAAGTLVAPSEGGAVTGVTGAPLTPSPNPSTKVLVE